MLSFTFNALFFQREKLTLNQRVQGSNPCTPTNEISYLGQKLPAGRSAELTYELTLEGRARSCQSPQQAPTKLSDLPQHDIPMAVVGVLVLCEIGGVSHERDGRAVGGDRRIVIAIVTAIGDVGRVLGDRVVDKNCRSGPPRRSSSWLGFRKRRNARRQRSKVCNLRHSPLSNVARYMGNSIINKDIVDIAIRVGLGS